MGYVTLVAGAVITSSWANAEVRDQVVSVHASAAARDSAVTAPVEGMWHYLSDVDTLTAYNGSGWVTGLQLGSLTSWTPTLTQTSTVTTTVTYGKYIRRGRWIEAMCRLDITGSGSGHPTAIVCSLPVTAATSGLTVGACSFYDASATTAYHGVAETNSTTTFIGSRDGNSNNVGYGSDPDVNAASSDVFWASLQYEAASAT